MDSLSPTDYGMPLDSLMPDPSEPVDDVTQVCDFLDSCRYSAPDINEFNTILELLDTLMFRRKEYSSLEPDVECRILKAIVGVMAVSEIQTRRCMFLLIQRFTTSEYLKRILKEFALPYHLEPTSDKLPTETLEIISSFAMLLRCAMECHRTGCYWMLQDVSTFINCLGLLDFSAKEFQSGTPAELSLTIRQLKVQHDAVKMERGSLAYHEKDAVEGYDVDPVLQEYWLKYVRAFMRIWDDEELRKWLGDEILSTKRQSNALIPSLINSLSGSGKKNEAVFIDYKKKEEEDELEFEANYVARLARYLLQQRTKPQQVVIAAVGETNAEKIREKTALVLGPENGIRIADIKAVDREYDTVIISTNCSPDAANSYDMLDIVKTMLKSRRDLYVLYSLSSVPPEWQLFSNMINSVGIVKEGIETFCEKHEVKQEIKHWLDFDSAVLEGGCTSACNYRFPCGHTCPRQCHPGDHSEVKCSQKCPKRCKQGLHPCSNLCFEDCGECSAKTIKELECGHIYTDALCHQPVDSLICKEECNRALPCGHKCKLRCSEKCGGTCTEEVEKELPCGHKRLMKCGDNNLGVPCEEMVKRTFQNCHHEVMMKCSDDASQCPSICGAPLPGCIHKCQAKCGKCYMGRLHEPCKEKCERKLICGHKCAQPCNGEEMCPPCQQPCEVECVHGKCGSFGNEVIRGCGEDCQLCTESCPNACKHRACSKQCGLVCDVDPCNEHCQKQSKCGRHKCSGLCGELCPDLCRMCDRKKWEAESKLFLGHEAGSKSRMIKLKDCGHNIEVQGMDQHVRKLIGYSQQSVSTPDPEMRTHPDPASLETETVTEAPAHAPSAVPENAAPSSSPSSLSIPETTSLADAETSAQTSATVAPTSIAPEAHSEMESPASKPSALEKIQTGELVANSQNDTAPSQAQSGTEGLVSTAPEQELAPTSSPRAIVQITCPKCRKVIRSSKRYQKILNQNMADIAEIKKLIRGKSPAQLTEERSKVIDSMNKELSAVIPNSVSNAELAGALKRIKDKTSVVNEEAVVSVDSLNRLRNVSKLFVELAKLAKSIYETDLLSTAFNEQFPSVTACGKRFFGDLTVKAKLMQAYNEISEYFFLHAVRLSTAMLQQLCWEIYRAYQLLNVGIILTTLARAATDFKIQQIVKYDQLCEVIIEKTEINEESIGIVKAGISALKELRPKGTLSLIEAERVLMPEALNRRQHVAKWYKCQNGHYFGGNDHDIPACAECESEQQSNPSHI